jgi:hypothetical protein
MAGFSMALHAYWDVPNLLCIGIWSLIDVNPVLKIAPNAQDTSMRMCPH